MSVGKLAGPIEKGIPMPPRKVGVNRKTLFWLRMKPGDSVEWLGKKMTAQTMASRKSRLLARRFTVRDMADGSVRIWRIS